MYTFIFVKHILTIHLVYFVHSIKTAHPQSCQKVSLFWIFTTLSPFALVCIKNNPPGPKLKSIFCASAISTQALIAGQSAAADKSAAVKICVARSLAFPRSNNYEICGVGMIISGSAECLLTALGSWLHARRQHVRVIKFELALPLSQYSLPIFIPSQANRVPNSQCTSSVMGTGGEWVLNWEIWPPMTRVMCSSSSSSPTLHPPPSRLRTRAAPQRQEFPSSCLSKEHTNYVEMGYACETIFLLFLPLNFKNKNLASIVLQLIQLNYLLAFFSKTLKHFALIVR